MLPIVKHSSVLVNNFPVNSLIFCLSFATARVLSDSQTFEDIGLKDKDKLALMLPSTPKPQVCSRSFLVWVQIIYYIPHKPSSTASYLTKDQLASIDVKALLREHFSRPSTSTNTPINKSLDVIPSTSSDCAQDRELSHSLTGEGNKEPTQNNPDHAAGSLSKVRFLSFTFLIPFTRYVQGDEAREIKKPDVYSLLPNHHKEDGEASSHGRDKGKRPMQNKLDLATNPLANVCLLSSLFFTHFMMYLQSRPAPVTQRPHAKFSGLQTPSGAALQMFGNQTPTLTPNDSKAIECVSTHSFDLHICNINWDDSW